MKKALFTLMVTIVMGMTMAACGGKKGTTEAAESDNVAGFVIDEDAEPVDQFISLTKQFVKTMNSAHIKSQADAEALKSTLTQFKDKMGELQKAIDNQMKEMSNEEKLGLASKMMEVASEVSGLEKTMKDNVERLEKEAEAAGVNLDDLDLD